MPFESEDTSGGETKTPEQIAADQAAHQAAAQAPATDHTSVFLVAGDRAFKDADSVVKNIENAQAHIATLEAERQADRDRLTAQDAELARLKKIEEGLTGRDTGNVDTTSQLSNEELAAHAAKLAVGLIQQSDTVAVQNANLAKAEAAAKEAYGEDYHAKVIDIAKQHGMAPSAIDALGKQSPTAFAQLFLPKAASSSHQPSTSTVNLATGNGQSGSETKPVNVTKLREKDRIAHVSTLMKNAGVNGY